MRGGGGLAAYWRRPDPRFTFKNVGLESHFGVEALRREIDLPFSMKALDEGQKPSHEDGRPSNDADGGFEAALEGVLKRCVKVLFRICVDQIVVEPSFGEQGHGGAPRHLVARLGIVDRDRVAPQVFGAPCVQLRERLPGSLSSSLGEVLGERRVSPLMAIQPDHWLEEYTRDLVDLLNAIGLLLELQGDQADLLAQVVAGDTVSDLVGAAYSRDARDEVESATGLGTGADDNGFELWSGSDASALLEGLVE